MEKFMLIGDGYVDTHAVEGVGRVLFQLESSIYLKIGSVLFVPEMRRNLLLVSALEDEEYAVFHV